MILYKVKSFNSKDISNIVIRGTNWIGDALMSFPAIQKIKNDFPNARITILTPNRNADLFYGQPPVDDVIAFNPKGSAYGRARRQANLIRGHKFDLGFVFPNSFESALALAMAKIPHRIGYATDFRSPLLTQSVAVPEWKSSKHESFYYLALTAAVSGQPVSPELPGIEFVATSSAINSAREILNRMGHKSERPVIAFGPGSTNSTAKRWPAAYFSQLCTLMASVVEADFVILGGSEDIEVASQVESDTKVRLINLTGKTTLSEAIGILSLSSVFISNDMGLAHIGAALDVRTAVIFGPTNDVTTRPLGKAVKIIREPVECSPCMLRICPIDHRCMNRIHPKRVFEEIRDWLG